MKFSLVYKLSLSAVILVLLSVGVVGGLFYNKMTNILVQHTLENIAGEIKNTGNQLQTHIDHQEKDTLLIANTPPIQGMLRALNNNNYDKQDKSTFLQWEQRVQAIFIAILKSKPIYLQIRFIDKRGQELIDVHRDGENFITHSRNELQNKAQSDYVRNTLKLPLGSVYLSEINLNREHGKISKPYLEVLRSATPVYDEKNNTLAGLVVVNTDIGNELRKIQNKVQDENSKIYITNDHGGYLLHPDSSKAYGFDLGKRFRIQEEFPRLSNLFLPDNKDTQVILFPDESKQKHVVSFVKIPFDPVRPERFIAVGISELYQTIVAKQSGVQNELILLALVMAVIVMLLAILFSYQIARPIKSIAQVMDDYIHHRESKVIMPVDDKGEVGILARRYQSLISEVEDAQHHLKGMNRNLEISVEERTADLNVSRIEAERANAAKSEFLSRMSHELRTPLNAILGFGQMLEMDSDALNETQRENVNEILEAGHHLLNLINEVLDLAKIESGKFELSMEDVAVDDAVQQSLSLISAQAKERQIVINDNVSGNNYSVRADYTRLKQVLLNLLSNAVKYNSEGGRIILQSEIIDAELKHLRISVIDSGEGLTKDELSRLFTPFDRLKEFANVEGTGIGLVITKHLVELMNGTIGVESTPNKGSTFWIELTLVQEPENNN